MRSLLPLALAASSFLASAARAGGPVGEPAVTGLDALHRSGQTFLVWDEITDDPAARYRVYRSHQPIDVSTLGSATLLQELPQDSLAFWADRIPDGRGGWEERYLERYVFEDLGGEVPVGTGGLVWTMHAEDFGGAALGQSYYAVTSVQRGLENVSLSAANTVGPVREEVADPAPVLVESTPQAHLFVQYLDLREFNPTMHAPNAVFGWYGLDPSDPRLEGAIQYAFPYVVAEPSVPAAEPLPLLVSLHGRQDHLIGGELNAALFLRPVLELRPLDLRATWWFGFARDHDYRTGTWPGPGGAVANYTEERVLRMVHDLLRDSTFGPRIDAQRVYVNGFSMGGTGALALALRYPAVFAAAFVAAPVTNFRTSAHWNPDVTPRWGAEALELPTQLDAPNGWGLLLEHFEGRSVWDWQNLAHDAEERYAAETVPFGLSHGLFDTVVEWPTQGQPLYGALELGRRAWGGVATANRHDLGEVSFFVGSPPPLETVDTFQLFHDFRVVRDESLPALHDVSDDPPLPPAGVAGYHQTIDWSTSWDPWDGAPLDTSALWRVSLRSTDGLTRTTSVTPRRLQAFAPIPEVRYHWASRAIADDALLGEGVVDAELTGLLELPAVPVTGAGVRLEVRRAQYALAVENLVAGQVATLRTAESDPHETQFVWVSSAGPGTTFLPEHLVFLGLAQPLLVATFPADAAGNGASPLPVPAGLTGLSLWLQAHHDRETTPVVAATVQ